MFCQHCGTLNSIDTVLCSTCRYILKIPEPAETPSAAVNLVVAATHVLLHNRYRLLSRLGQGGFGSVFKAENTLSQNKIVAIKEIRLTGLQQQEVLDATASFNREVQVLSDLRHPGLPRLYDYFTDADHWYLVMDFIEGETLERHLEQTIGGHFLRLTDVLRIGIQLCIVLDYMHTHQPPIIFRDLKPSNVMLIPNGSVRLIDFGIARYFKPGQFKDTIALGSPGYAAPEQYGKAQTTPYADIYSLGALLHQMLTGNDPTETPFRFKSLHTYSVNHPQAAALRILDRLLMQMVALDPANRPGSMALVKQHLEYIAEQIREDKK
ncbi:MAG: hypothetical protein PVS3B3_33370 [Ktedonobacteraceae bacterium]